MKNLKRALCLFLALVMCLGMLPMSVLAAGADTLPPVKVDHNGAEGVTVNGDSGTSITGKKTIAPVDGSKDEFDITLEVVTKSMSSTTIVSNAGDVLLVLDVTGSMDDGGKWGQMKTAVSGFVDKLLPQGNTANRVAIVIYAGLGYHVLCDWTTDAATVKQTYQSANNSGALRNKIERGTNGTNCQAGFLGADVQMNTARADALQYVIYMTDGDANRSYYSSSAVPDNANLDNYSVTLWGSHSSRAIMQTTQLKTNHPNTKLIAIGFGTDANNQVVSKTFNTSLDQSYTTGNLSFDDILSDISSEIKDAVGAAGTVVTDPMSDYVTFESAESLPAGASYDEASKTLSWDLSKAQKTEVKEGDYTTTTYTMTYRVKVVRDEAFYNAIKANGSVATNGRTTMAYKLGDQEDTLEFDVPTVKSEQPVAVTGTVSMGDWTYGDTAATPTYALNGYGNDKYTGPVITYKAKDAADSTYTTEKPTDAGEYMVKATWTLKSDPNVTVIATDPFEVSKRSVTLTSDSLSKPYDGTALTNGDTPLANDGTKDQPANGGWTEADAKNVEYVFDGSQTLPGEGTNTFRVVAKGDTKLSNYTITKTEGTLTVTDRGENEKFEIAVTAGSDTVTYDGNPHNVTSYTIDAATGENKNQVTINGQTYTVVSGLSASVSDEAKNAGSYDVIMTVNEPKATENPLLIKDAAGNDVTAQFKVTAHPGKLTINKRQVILTSASDSKQYDGTPLTAKTVTPNDGGFIGNDGENYTVTFTGSQTIVGGSPNTFTYTAKDGTNLDNYNITCAYGTLTVRPLDVEDRLSVTVTANSKTVVYNGVEQSVEGFVGQRTNGKIPVFVGDNVFYVSGLTATASGTDANADGYDTTINGTAVVTDAAGNDVTEQFAVNAVPGKLVINKKQATLTSATADKVFDGTELTDHTITADGFINVNDAEAQKWCRFTGTRTLPGTAENQFTYTLPEGIAKNYLVTPHFGTLTVKNRDTKYTVQVTADSLTATYDGTPKTVNTWKVTNVNGEKVTDVVDTFTIGTATYKVAGYVVNETRTDAGTYTVNAVGTPQVLLKQGDEWVDVTSQFAMEAPVSGTLEISPKAVTLKSADLSKVYDGTALTNGDTNLEAEDGWVGTDGATYLFTGSQTLPGEGTNAFRVVAKGDTKLSNYTITQTEGKLTVTDRKDPSEDPEDDKSDDKYEITLTAKSGEATYDGTEHTVSGFKNVDANGVYTYVSPKGVTYKVTGMTTEPFTGTNAGTYSNEPNNRDSDTGILSGVKVEDAAGNDVTSQFIVKAIAGTLTIKPRPVTLTSASDSKEYNGTALTNSDVGVTSGSFVDGEAPTYNVTGSQTIAGSSPNSFELVWKNGVKESNYAVTKVLGTLTVTSRTAKYAVEVKANSTTATYDGTEKSVSGFENAENGLVKVTVDSKDYYVYVGGMTAAAKGTDADTYVTTISNTNTVKVYDGNGADKHDVTTEFAVTILGGTLKINPVEVTLRSADREKPYDGTALTNGTTPLEGNEPENWVKVDGKQEGINVTFTGSQTVVGSSINHFTYTAKTGTNLRNYIINASYGNLTVKDRTDDERFAITLTANSDSVKYNGKNQTVAGFTVSGEGVKDVGNGTFTLNGQVFVVSGVHASGTGKNAGTYPVTFDENQTAKITDAQGNDVTKQFKTPTYVACTLVITKRQVTLTSEDAEKVYDGTPLYNHNVTVGGDGFAEGDGATYSDWTEVTLVTEEKGVSNKFEYVLNEGTDADNYEITKTPGTLTITSRTDPDKDPSNPDNHKYEITVVAKSDTVTYDGKGHTVNGFTVSGLPNNGVEYTVVYMGEGTVSATGTDAGTYDITIAPEDFVVHQGNDDVTAQFLVNTQNGGLTIEKRNAVLTSGSASKQFDGNSLTNDTVILDGFVEKDKASVNAKANGTITNVGNATNTITYDAAVDKNYNVTKVEGTLMVTNRDAKYEITVEAHSLTAKYDGTEKSVSDLKATTFEIGGNTYTVTGLSASETKTDAGNYSVKVTGTAMVKLGELDVTEQFLVNRKDGELVIEKRNVTLTSATKEKVYDGNALTDDNVTVDGDGFVEGDGATYSVTGSQTLVGSSENYFSYKLNEGTKADNYNITTNNGTLKVTSTTGKYEIKVTAPTETYTYDGTTRTIREELSGTVTFDGEQYTYSGLVASGSDKNAGTYDVTVTGTLKVVDKAGNDVSDKFTFTAETGKLIINKRVVTLTSATDSKVYDGTPLTNHNVTVSGDGFVNGEGVSFNVTGTQTLPNKGVEGLEDYDTLNTFTYTLNGGAKEENYEITKIEGKLTVTGRTDKNPENPNPGSDKYEITVVANSYDGLYDGEEHTVSGFKQTVFEFGGVEFTVSGITSEAKGTNVADSKSEIEVSGTPVVKDAAGNDVTSQFKVEVKPGHLTITKRNVTLTSGSAERMYDGTALTNGNVTEGGDGFADGEGATYTVTGTQTIVGSSTNEFTYELNEGTEAGNYNITTKYGTLTVKDRNPSTPDPEGKQYEITVKAKDVTVPYDGTAKTGELLTTTFVVNGQTFTVEGLSAVIEGGAEAKNAGTYTVKVDGTAVVKDAADNDVTAQFIVNRASGTLRITKLDVILTSATDSKQYDGEELTNDTVTAVGFIDGEGASYNVTGSQTIVGISANRFTYALNEGTEAGNYNITVHEGTLTVTNRDAKFEITVKANSAEVTYNGREQTFEGFVTTTFEVEGNTYTVGGLTAKGTGTDAGEYTVTVEGTAKVFDENGLDVTEQFSVSADTGLLFITKRNVTLTSATDEKVYDGDPLTNDKVTVSGDGFADGEGATYNVTGTRTLPSIEGEVTENTFTYTLNEGTKAENYNITTENGILTVKDRNVEPEDPDPEKPEDPDKQYEITVEANSDTVTYDGEEHEVKGFKTLEFVVNGHTYTVEGLEASATGKNANKDGYTVKVSGTAIVKDEEGNDVTAQFKVATKDGKLVINPKELTIPATATDRTYSSGNVTVSVKLGDLVGIVGEDEVSIENPVTSGTMANADAGYYKSVTIDELKLTGAAAGNYILKQPVVVVSITPPSSSGGGGGSNPNPNPNPGGGGVDIEDEDPPLANVDGNLNTTDHFAYIIGRGEDCVQPLENITRAEVATIFFRLLTEDFRVANWSTVSSFPDVEAGAWYATEIATAEKAGILKGCDDGNMQPNRDITRAEFTVMAIRFLNGTIEDDGTGDFADTANHWAAKEIRLAAKAGWIKGYGNNFRPNDPITRAEAMTIINRMLDRVPGDTFPAGTIEWGDNPKGAWYYADVMEATNGHDYEREEGSVVEKWTAITPYRDWIALEAEWTANNGASAPASEKK